MRGPGETTITVQWFQSKTVAEGETLMMPTTPYSKVTYGRNARSAQGRGMAPGRNSGAAYAGS